MTKSSLKLPQKLMLLGSGEVGMGFAIAAKRLGNHLIAVADTSMLQPCKLLMPGQ